VATFFLTHGYWYDALAPEQKALFWTEAMAAYGTLALAIVTWGSVRESQQVVADEGLRFRQARMPMVKVAVTRRELGGALIGLRNDGDGAAANVYVTFDAHTRITWNNSGSADHDQEEENNVAGERELFSSFMPVGEAGERNILFGAPDSPTMRPGASASIKFSRLVVEYDDVFGASYTTEHDCTVGGDLIPYQFVWNPPRELIPRRQGSMR
jgi:hypothetical protein